MRWRCLLWWGERLRHDSECCECDPKPVSPQSAFWEPICPIILNWRKANALVNRSTGDSTIICSFNTCDVQPQQSRTRFFREPEGGRAVREICYWVLALLGACVKKTYVIVTGGLRRGRTFSARLLSDPCAGRPSILTLRGDFLAGLGSGALPFPCRTCHPRFD